MWQYSAIFAAVERGILCAAFCNMFLCDITILADVNKSETIKHIDKPDKVLLQCNAMEYVHHFMQLNDEQFHKNFEITSHNSLIIRSISQKVSLLVSSQIIRAQIFDIIGGLVIR